MLEKGYDVIFSEPGTHQSLPCRVCGREMQVQRDCVGPTGFASAMARQQIKHDRWTCPNADQEWHQQVRQLRHQLEAEASPTVRAIKESDIQQMLNAHLSQGGSSDIKV